MPDSPDWSRVKDIFHAAADLSGAERDAFLSQVCGGDLRLRDEVEALLASVAASGSFLETPAPDGVLAELAAEPDGQRIGAYRLVREIGRGGMGTVYLAVRADDEYRKQVAIKVIRRGMDTRDIVERFRRERQTLAGLVHPNIARLLDGGTTPDGRPFFVMDYVEGVPIDEFCDARRLTVPTRLELFRQVCAGVRSAHQNLVVHRDLKPDNIVVTVDGVPRLVDFGIAKVLTDDGASPTLTAIDGANRPMTLAYASPEQVSGGAITTATDIYSLGVLLYELLTGCQPYRVRDGRRDAMMTAILEQEPDKPSVAVGTTTSGGAAPAPPSERSAARGTTPDRLRRRLAGDIDTIILKALRKEPQRRYGSVEEFSDDIQRYLTGRPVIAQKDSWQYRVRKFVARHKAGVAAAVVVAIALASGVVAVAWQAGVARREAQKADRINQFMQQMLNSTNPARQGEDLRVTQLLEQASQRAATELQDEPDVRAAVLRTIADAYISLGRYAEAEPLLQAALSGDREAFGERHERVFRDMATLGLVSYHRGEFKKAEDQFRVALAGLQELGGPQGPSVADVQNVLGLVLNDTGRVKEAEAAWRQARDVRIARGDTANQDYANLLNNLAIARYNQGDLDQAQRLYGESIAVWRAIPGPPGAELAATLQNVGVVQRLKGQHADAEASFREAIALRVKLLGEAHPFVAMTRAHLADVLTRVGDYATAEAEARRAFAIQDAALPAGHVDRARSLSVLGFALTRAGRPAEGEPHLREAIAIRRTVLPPGHWLIASIESMLGECLAAQGLHAEATALLQAAGASLAASLGASHPATLENAQRLASVNAVAAR